MKTDATSPSKSVVDINQVFTALEPWVFSIAVFFSSAVLMIFEILAGRLLSPFFGSDIYVWGNIIGVFLLGISLGNWCGGKLADRSRTPPRIPFSFLLAAGLWIGFVPLWVQALCTKFLSLDIAKPWDSFFACLFIFLPPTFFLSLLTPSAARWAAGRTTKLGDAFGSVGSLAGLGSLSGTFLTTFVLLRNPHLGTAKILFLSGAGLFWLALISLVIFGTLQKRGLFLFLLAGYLQVQTIQMRWDAQFFLSRNREALVEQVESANTVIQVTEWPSHDGTMRAMRLAGSLPQALIVLDNNLSEKMLCLRALSTAWLTKPDTQRVAIIGAGGGIGAREMLRWLPKNQTNFHLDVVDIEAPVFDLATKYFGYPSSDIRLKSHVQDGRQFLRMARKPYDFIVMDAYNNCNKNPEHLLTREFFTEVKGKLSADGNFMLNLISPYDIPLREGGERKVALFASLLKTLRTVFNEGEVRPIPMNKLIAKDWSKEQGNYMNIMILATKKPPHFHRESFQTSFSKNATSMALMKHLDQPDPPHSTDFQTIYDNAPLITDDFNPVNLLSSCI